MATVQPIGLLLSLTHTVPSATSRVQPIGLLLSLTHRVTVSDIDTPEVDPRYLLTPPTRVRALIAPNRVRLIYGPRNG